VKVLFSVIGTGILILVFVAAAYKNNAVPANIGLDAGVPAPLPDTPNAVSSQTEQYDKSVDPLPFFGNLEQTKARIKRAVTAFGGAQVVTEKDDYLHVVFTLPLIPFKDDAEFFFSAKERQVHYRSASRLGYSDLGVNRKRYIRIRSLYEQDR